VRSSTIAMLLASQAAGLRAPLARNSATRVGARAAVRGSPLAARRVARPTTLKVRSAIPHPARTRKAWSTRRRHLPNDRSPLQPTHPGRSPPVREGEARQLAWEKIGTEHVGTRVVRSVASLARATNGQHAVACQQRADLPSMRNLEGISTVGERQGCGRIHGCYRIVEITSHRTHRSHSLSHRPTAPSQRIRLYPG